VFKYLSEKIHNNFGTQAAYFFSTRTLKSFVSMAECGQISYAACEHELQCAHLFILMPDISGLKWTGSSVNHGIIALSVDPRILAH